MPLATARYERNLGRVARLKPEHRLTGQPRYDHADGDAEERKRHVEGLVGEQLTFQLGVRRCVDTQVRQADCRLDGNEGDGGRGDTKGKSEEASNSDVIRTKLEDASRPPETGHQADGRGDRGEESCERRRATWNG